MKTILLFFALLASIAANAAVKVTPLSANYSAVPPTVTFKVEWQNTTIPYNNRVWVWVDYCPVTSTTPATSFSTATVSSPTKTGGNGTITGATTRGFFIEYANATNTGTTVTAKLSNASGKFNWCAYGSDYPPNAVINGNSYTLKGTPPFVVNDATLGAGVTSYSGGCITSITDATGCPGIFPIPTTTLLSTNTTTICRGASAVLTASASGANSYSFDNGSSWQTATTKTVSPTTTTDYTLKVRSSAGCVSSDSKSITVTVDQRGNRDAAPNSGCCSGLTVVGSYCRDLTADNALSACNLEWKKSAYTLPSDYSSSAHNCPSGWRPPTYANYVCVINGGLWNNSYMAGAASDKITTGWDATSQNCCAANNARWGVWNNSGESCATTGQCSSYSKNGVSFDRTAMSRLLSRGAKHRCVR